MRVALVCVGDELLTGDTVNTNAAWLGAELADRGVAVERVTVVPDRVDEVASVVAAHHDEYDAVLTTGGLGPTHDDVTVEAVALAFDRDLKEHQEALEQITDEGGYAREDLAAGTAHLPVGSRSLRNPVGVAPGCVVENCYVLPGVPTEMKAMFGEVASEFDVGSRHVAVVETPEPESALVDRLDAVRERFDVQVGSYPGETVRVRFQDPEEGPVHAAAEWFRERVEAPENGDRAGEQ